VIISFDDGYSDVFQNAFPIMQEYGFVGTIYLHVDRIGSSAFLSVGEIQSLMASGWEVGSHTMSHPDLTKDHSIVDYEVQESRAALEQMTGGQVASFAYPYGELDDYITSIVRDSGYNR
jgi:peptidoglycan/xylan/chitin deacetylase (PgdA/CDA1 family)